MKHLALILTVVLVAACNQRAVRLLFDGGASADSGQHDASKPPQVWDRDPLDPRIWKTLKAGTFMMGSPLSEKCREPAGAGKETRHKVILTNDFKIQITEITQAQFKALMGYSGAYFTACGKNCPADDLNWNRAAAYCNALSAREGLKACYECHSSGWDLRCLKVSEYSMQKVYSCPGYRLPTEAEWEYAYRAGKDAAYYDGTAGSDCVYGDVQIDKLGWHNGNSKVSFPGSCNHAEGCRGPHPVGLKGSNAWGLYDMAGNVYEWCHDGAKEDLGSMPVTDPWGLTDGPWRVYRGGSWVCYPPHLRAASRNYQSTGQTLTEQKFGARCVKSIIP